MSGSQDVRYKARLLSEMLNDPTNKLYFIFATPIVTEFERINAKFQSTNENPQKLLSELKMLYDGLKFRVIDPCGNRLPLAQVQYGARFNKELANHEKRPEVAIDNIKTRCCEMLRSLVSQVEKRLPDKLDLFGDLSYLIPSRVLSHTNRVPLEQLPYQSLIDQNLDQLDEQ